AHQILSGHVVPQVQALRLLLCVGQRSTGPSMLDVAVLLGSTGLGDATALHISRPSERTSALVSSGESGSFAEERTNALALMLERAQERNARIVPLATESSFPAREILAASRRQSADLVVLGWHRPVISANILGGIVGEVIAESASPVAILISSGHTAPQRIVGLVSDTGSGRLVRELAFRMARTSGAELVLLAPATEGNNADRQVEPVRDERFPMIRAVLITSAGMSNERAALEELGSNTDLLLVPTDGVWGPATSGISLESSSLLTRMAGRTTLMVHARADWQPPILKGS
ncbi:MAG: universal stress protein, partial [Myxococcales bacterium]|nr:universal stress protein [Myxococcales bacterium]